METSKNNVYTVILKKAIWITVSVIGAVILPQIFHVFGILTEQGASFGRLFLPMYLPVLILAFKAGAVAGVTAGILSPLVSFAVSGMPTATMLPYILIELVCIGLFAGLINNTTWHIFTKIVTVQMASRAVRTVATVIGAYAITGDTVTVDTLLYTLLLSVPGFILQLLVVPYFMKNGSSSDE